MAHPQDVRATQSLDKVQDLGGQQDSNRRRASKCGVSNSSPLFSASRSCLFKNCLEVISWPQEQLFMVQEIPWGVVKFYSSSLSGLLDYSRTILWLPFGPRYLVEHRVGWAGAD